MRALLLLPLLLLGCDSGSDPFVPPALDLTGVYTADYSGPGEGTATWEIEGSDVTLHLEPGTFDGFRAHTLTGTYFASTRDMRLTGVVRALNDLWDVDATFEGVVTFNGETVTGTWTGVSRTPSPIVEMHDVTLTRR